MNLTEVRMKLFKVKVSEIAVQDAFGIHIGDNLPTRNPDVPLHIIKNIYIAGVNVKDAVDFLSKHKIDISAIEEVSILLNC